MDRSLYRFHNWSLDRFPDRSPYRSTFLSVPLSVPSIITQSGPIVRFSFRFPDRSLNLSPYWSVLRSVILSAYLSCGQAVPQTPRPTVLVCHRFPDPPHHGSPPPKSSNSLPSTFNECILLFQHLCKSKLLAMNSQQNSLLNNLARRRRAPCTSR